MGSAAAWNRDTLPALRQWGRGGAARRPMGVRGAGAGGTGNGPFELQRVSAAAAAPKGGEEEKASE